MKTMVKKYKYFIPNKYKEIDLKDYQYYEIALFGKKWKIWNDVKLGKYNDDSDFGPIEKKAFENRETKSSLAIEGVNSNDKNFDKILSDFNNSRKYLFKLSNLTKENLNEIYLKASNNEKHINEETNIKLNQKSLFRMDDIYIGSEKALYKGIELENNVTEFLNFFNSQNRNYINSVIFHFFFEHLHPFPDYNGRIGRMLYSWYSKELHLSVSNLSNMIENNRSDYYKSIELSEKYNDLTYSLIFFNEITNLNVKFYEKFISSNSELNIKYIRLSEKQQQTLFNLYSVKSKFSWKEYKEYFKDNRTKQQIHNDFKELLKNDFIEYEEFKNNLRRYKIKNF